MQSTPSNPPPVDPVAERPASRLRRPWLPLLLVVVGVGVYLNGLDGPFVFDDVPQIVEDPSVQSLWPLSDVVRGTNRPVLKLSFALNWAMGGDRVRGYHVTNVVIHVLAALALFGVVRRTLRLEGFSARLREAASGLGFAVALLWVVHPLQTESVTYVFQRGESLMGLFYLLALYCTIRAATAPRAGWWAAAAVGATALGIGTKEVMVTVPLVVLLYDRAFLARSFGAALRRRWGLYAALASLWFVTGALVVGLLFKEDTTAGFGVEGIGPLQYALAQPGVVLHYLVLSIWPRGLCLDYGWAPVDGFLGQVAPLLVIGALLAGTVHGLWRNAWYGFVGAWFFLVLAPSSSFLPIADLAVEHRMYLSLAAVVVLVVGGAYRALAAIPGEGRLLGGALLGLAVLALGGATIQRNREYADAITLWQTVVARAPGNPRGHLMLGNAQREAGLLGDARDSFARALEVDANHIPSRTNLASLLQMLGEHGEAITHFQRVAELEPGFEHDTNLGNAYLRAGRVTEAIDRYKQALSQRPGYAPAQSNFGAALMELGHVNEAILHLEQALAVAPDDVAALTNLGNALYRKDDVEGALARYRRALEIDPDYGLAHVNLGEVLLAGGRPEDAEVHFRRARELATSHPDRVCDHGRVLLALGRASEALAAFRFALRLHPDHAEALFSAAEALVAGGDPAGYDATEVVQLAERAILVTRRRVPATLMRLAEVYAATGDLARAIDTVERSLTLSKDPDEKAAFAARRDEWRRALGAEEGGAP